MVRRFCDWYICRIDYGRPNVWAPMYWLYLACNVYVNGRSVLVGDDGHLPTGRWMEQHVWGDVSAVATNVTDACDLVSDGLPRKRVRWLAGFVVDVLGTGNYFGGRLRPHGG